MSTASIRSGFECQTRSVTEHHRWKPGFGRPFLAFCLLAIAAISALDIWFAVANTCIQNVEQNPVCLALIKLDPVGFSFFILGKSTGTLMVILTLVLLHVRRYRFATTVTIAITLFQIGLLVCLTLSDPLTYNLPNFGLLFRDSTDSVWILD